MIKVLCDRCKLTIHNEMAFKICMVGKATITDTCILCASCMKQVASDVLEEEKKRAKENIDNISKVFGEKKESESDGKL